MKNNKYKIAVFAVFTLVIVLLALAKPYWISGDCMEPAIRDGRLYFLNRISPYIRQYRIGDIIAFKYKEKLWISRIVALEASTIQIIAGNVIVDGAVLQNQGIHRNWSCWKHGVYAIDTPLQVPTDYVFVLSDNLSAQHDDSRIFGPISKDSILGLVW